MGLTSRPFKLEHLGNDPRAFNDAGPVADQYLKQSRTLGVVD
jgi:hypothetical protein